ncbi:MAG: DUF4417 domain-containing protein [Clostridiales Family XIII bacterium]|jgi:hypothetical protein|nr:DUF4417 domain-containing protein [Clostridiales Family XIII bacterium]
MKSVDYRNDELFLRNNLFVTGNFEMPFVYSQDILLENIELIAFSNTKTEETSPTQKLKTVHFFLDDYKFDEVWNNPDGQLVKLSQYSQLMSPGFSLYTDMPEPLQIYNTFRNRWCAAYWQLNKLVVIPTIVWGGENTFDFCFESIENGCIVAISTIGVQDDEYEFMAGYKAMCDIIQPEAVINYGEPFETMSRYAKLISLPYRHASNDKADE